MPRYRRIRAEGGTYAFTVCLADRSATTLMDHIGLLREAYARTVRDHPVRDHAMCVLPDHLHALWTLPPGDADYPLRWQLIKRRFGDALGRRVWQPRYWEHTIRDADDHANHVNYVHGNPVKHGHVREIDDWPHSTWHRWKREHGAPWTPPPGDMRMA